jgi:azurin
MMIARQYAFAVLALAAASLFGGTGVARAADKVCQLAISANDAMQYDKKELDVAADCSEVTLTLTHTGKLPAAAMGHNWVLVKGSDVTPVATAGMSAGLANNYLQPGDARVIAATRIVGGGESTSVTFPTSKLVKGGDYNYICTFPGHYVIMKGVLKFG